MPFFQLETSMQEGARSNVELLIQQEQNAFGTLDFFCLHFAVVYFNTTMKKTFHERDLLQICKAECFSFACEYDFMIMGD